MSVLTGTLNAQQTLRFIPLENSTSLLIGLDYSTITNSDGSYNLTIENGTYTVHVGDRIYKNVEINADGSLNDFLERANGRNM